MCNRSWPKQYVLSLSLSLSLSLTHTHTHTHTHTLSLSPYTRMHAHTCARIHACTHISTCLFVCFPNELSKLLIIFHYHACWLLIDLIFSQLIWVLYLVCLHPLSFLSFLPSVWLSFCPFLHFYLPHHFQSTQTFIIVLYTMPRKCVSLPPRHCTSSVVSFERHRIS